MESSISENIILWDWLTFTSKTHDPWELVEALGMDGVSWTQMEKGRYGYKCRLQFGHIAILYDGSEEMGVCCDMSGQGCREFESYSKLPGRWEDLFCFIRENGLNVTRLDVAFDDHTGLLDMMRLEEDTRRYRFVTRFHVDPLRGGPDIKLTLRGPDLEPGKTIYFGNEKNGKVLFRIYDKAAERGYTDDTHWVRFEMQLRKERASAFLCLTKIDDAGNTVPMPVGEAFAGVVLNYLRFVEPSGEDSNKRRWPMTDYWSKLLGDVSRISLYTAPGTEYNVEKCKNTVQNHWGNAISAVLSVCQSLKDFKKLIDDRKCKPNPKYEVMLKEYFAEQKRQDALALRVSLQMQLDREESEYIEDERTGLFNESAYDDYQMNWWEAPE